MTLNQLLWTGLAIVSAIGRPALAWEAGEPFPKAQCGPQPATFGQDIISAGPKTLKAINI